MSNNKHVLKLQSPFEKIKKSNTHGEVALFRSVITQMIIDSTNISDKIESKKLAQNAREWLFKKNDNFSAICTMANIDQNLVRKIASELIRMHVQKTHKKSIAKVEVGVEVGSPMTLPEELYINIETRITEQFSMLEFTY